MTTSHVRVFNFAVFFCREVRGDSVMAHGGARLKALVYVCVVADLTVALPVVPFFSFVERENDESRYRHGDTVGAVQ